LQRREKKEEQKRSTKAYLDDQVRLKQLKKNEVRNLKKQNDEMVLGQVKKY